MNPTSQQAALLALDVVDAALADPDNPAMAADMVRAALFACGYEMRPELAIALATALAVQTASYMTAAQRAGVDTEQMRLFARLSAGFAPE